MLQQGASLLLGGRPDASRGSRLARRSARAPDLHRHHYLPSDISPANLKYKPMTNCCKCREMYRPNCLSRHVTLNWMVVSPVSVAPIYPQRLVVFHRVVLEIAVSYLVEVLVTLSLWPLMIYTYGKNWILNTEEVNAALHVVICGLHRHAYFLNFKVEYPTFVINIIIYYFLWLCSPARAMAFWSTRFRDHTLRRATVGSTPLDEWSPFVNKQSYRYTNYEM
jgi:hypothetical protein